MKKITTLLIAALAAGTVSSASAGGLDLVSCDGNQVLNENGDCVTPVVLPVSSFGAGLTPGLGLALAAGGLVAVGALVASGGGSSPTTTTLQAN